MLVNREGGEQYATHLAWFYLGIEDYRSLTELLDYYESRYGYAAWLHFYRGVLAYEQHRYAEAGDHFEKSLQGRRFWRSYYNAALARARAGSVQEALNLLDKARIQCGGKRECDAVHFAQADIHLQHGNYQKAQEQLARGFELDPHDIDGRLLQEVLKERID
jgi:tetratricopeptide (TPR) repeat protein